MTCSFRGDPHHVLRGIVDQLTNAIQGYSLPDPYFIVRINALLDNLIKVAIDWRVPLLEMRGLCIL